MDPSASDRRKRKAYHYDSIAQASSEENIRKCETDLEKAAQLRIIYNFSLRSLASYFHLWVNSIQHAVRAIEEGRPVGACGRGQLLSNESEDELLEIINSNREAKTSLAPTQVIEKAREIYRKQEASRRKVNLFDDSEMKFSFGWYHGFMKRHEGSLHTGPRKLIEYTRAEVPRESFVSFFQTLENLFEKSSFHPALVANMDETSIELTSENGRFKKVVIPLSESEGYVKKPTSLAHVTLASTIFSDGEHGRSYVLFPRKKAPKVVEQLELPRVVLDGSERGWMTSAHFERWVEKCFLPDVEEIRKRMNLRECPALLLIDGHRSRINSRAMRRLRSANIVCFTLVAYSSHVLQPMDVGINSAFKSILGKKGSEYKKIVMHEYWKRLILESISSFQSAANIQNVRRAFERSGIYPVDPNKILHHPLHAPKPQAELGIAPSSRRGLHISCRVLTELDAIHEIEEAERGGSSSVE